MADQTAIRFDDLLVEAVTAIQSMVRRGTGWEGALPEEKGRAIELDRGLAGELRYAKVMNEPALMGLVDALKMSAHAQLRMLEGRTTPGDEEVAGRFDSDVAAYVATVGRETSDGSP